MKRKQMYYKQSVLKVLFSLLVMFYADIIISQQVKLDSIPYIGAYGDFTYASDSLQCFNIDGVKYEIRAVAPSSSIGNCYDDRHWGYSCYENGQIIFDIILSSYQDVCYPVENNFGVTITKPMDTSKLVLIIRGSREHGHPIKNANDDAIIMERTFFPPSVEDIKQFVCDNRLSSKSNLAPFIFKGKPLQGHYALYQGKELVRELNFSKEK